MNSVWINKTDYWAVDYTKDARDSENELTPKMQETAWSLVQGEDYLHQIANKYEQSLLRQK